MQAGYICRPTQNLHFPYTITEIFKVPTYYILLERFILNKLKRERKYDKVFNFLLIILLYYLSTNHYTWIMCV